MAATNEYWVEYNPDEGGKITNLKYHHKAKDDKENEEEIKKYRSRFTQPDYEEFENVKQAGDELARLTYEIEREEEKINRDKRRRRLQEELEYAKDEEDLRNKELSLRKAVDRKKMVNNYIENKQKQDR